MCFFLFFLLLFFLFLFFDKVYLHSPGYLGIHYVDHVALELTEIQCLCILSAGCLSFGFVVVMKHHDQGIPSKEKHLVEAGLQFQGFSPL